MSKRPKIKLGFRLDEAIDKGVWRIIRSTSLYQILDHRGAPIEKLAKLSTRKLVRRLTLTHRLLYIKTKREVDTYNDVLARQIKYIRGCEPFGGFFRFQIVMPGGEVYYPPSSWHCCAALCPHCHARRIEDLFNRLSKVAAQRYEIISLQVPLIGEHTETKDQILRFNENLGQKLRGRKSLVLRMLLPTPAGTVLPWRLQTHVLLLDPGSSQIRWEAFQKRWNRLGEPLERSEGSWQPQTSPEAFLSLWKLPRGLYAGKVSEIESAIGRVSITLKDLHTFTSRLE